MPTLTADRMPLPRVKSDPGPPQYSSRVKAEAEVGSALLDSSLDSLLCSCIHTRQTACVALGTFSLDEERTPQLFKTTKLGLLAFLLPRLGVLLF